MFVKPRPGGPPVRDPHTKRFLPLNGKQVPESAYWIRRVLTGDVVVVDTIHDSKESQGEQ